MSLGSLCSNLAFPYYLVMYWFFGVGDKSLHAISVGVVNGARAKTRVLSDTKAISGFTEPDEQEYASDACTREHARGRLS
ncbi:hypothetical protein EV681_3652 [Advenella incenata]|uniref:Uncharacterized protein n=1 Tax=Advenella incenata TaxID=267800 RepID=A0A4Q7V886_9BURK|nr:hypothetical protein EV681_3652 [Advenella incenata]